MVYRVTAVFSDTESAERTARRISSENGVYEICMRYRGEGDREGPSPTGRIIYEKNTSAAFPVPLPGENKSFLSASGGEIPPDEISMECGMTVYCEEKTVTPVSRAIVNGGGYDTDIREERPMN